MSLKWLPTFVASAVQSDNLSFALVTLWQRVDIGVANSPLGSLEDACAASQGKLRRAVRRAVDDEDLAYGTGLAQSLMAPRNELGHGQFLVYCRDDDAHLR